MASARREGFERVLSSVALGEVGIVGSWEVSRLSRTDKDWCRLLEVCQIFGTLIADEQHIYDLNSLDDQLVLGIKGTLSVVELKVLRQRMQAGQESKARRGELFKRLPVGYVLDAMRKVAFHHDRRVHEALQLVFIKFRERWSVRQTFQWFRDHDVELPANPMQGTRLVWKIPSQSLIRDILCNPFYAGAYVWGRRPVITRLVEGRLEKRQGATRRAEECRVFIRDHHVGYIDWATFEENQRMIRRNSVNWPGDESMAAIRAGQGLLAGLLRCGHCGRKLHVRYWGGRGTNARYLCKGDYDDGGQYCIGFGGASVDRRLGQELLKAISQLGVEASLKAIEELSAGDVAQRVALSSKLKQLEYEARKAFEQYDAVDARNRLAAGELERRWNEKLEEVEITKQRLSSLNGNRHSLSSEDEAHLRYLGERFADLWQSDRCPSELKKMIFRTVMEEIIVRADAEKKLLQFTIHWKGDTHTQIEIERPRPATEMATSMEALDIIRRMAIRSGDDQIASVLNRLGYSTGKEKRWNQIRVATARRNHSIPGQKRAAPDPERISLSEAARLSGVSHHTIERLVEAGLLKREQAAPRAPWEIRRADLDREPVRSIIERLLRTGKLVFQGDCAEGQSTLFNENQGDDNARHHE
ncbi:MAG TPA: recombinase family protein [Terracidiphilus sp.]|nr:recombinase family protein [Terracidiphilus sp.]